MDSISQSSATRCFCVNSEFILCHTGVFWKPCEPAENRMLFHTPAANHVWLHVYKKLPHIQPAAVFFSLLFLLSLFMSHFLSFSETNKKPGKDNSLPFFFSLSLFFKLNLWECKESISKAQDWPFSSSVTSHVKHLLSFEFFAPSLRHREPSADI